MESKRILTEITLIISEDKLTKNAVPKFCCCDSEPPSFSILMLEFKITFCDKVRAVQYFNCFINTFEYLKYLYSIFIP